MSDRHTSFARAATTTRAPADARTAQAPARVTRMPGAEARRWALYGVGAALLVGLGAALGASGSGIVSHPTDFSIYYAAARTLVSGGNPYDWHTLRHVVATVPAPGYVYPLWGLIAVLPLAWLPLPVAAGIWLMVNLACLALALLELARAAGLPARSYWIPGLFLLTCLSIPGLFVLIQGQVSLLLLVCVASGLRAARDERGTRAGVLVALSLLKPQLTWLPVVVVLAVAWRRGVGRAALTAAGATVGGLVAVSFALRPGWLAGWAAALGQDAAQGGAGASALRANMGTVPALAAHLPGAWASLVLGGAFLAGGGLLAWQGWRVLRASAREDMGEQLTLLAVAICVGTALSPWMWIYDGVFWLVPLIAAVARGPVWRGGACALIFWAVPWGVRLAHVATAGGGTSLNKLEDVLVAPALLALVLVWTGEMRAGTAAPARSESLGHG